jgi:hypothetical protein
MVLFSKPNDNESKGQEQANKAVVQKKKSNILVEGRSPRNTLVMCPADRTKTLSLSVPCTKLEVHK